jgi:hypothetical protein
MNPEEQELLDLTARLLDYIHRGDVESYRALSAEDLTCFETDVVPYRIDGVEFHIGLMQTMSEHHAFDSLVRFDLLTPKVQIHGDCGVVTYTRLMTYGTETGPRFTAFNESRVYSKASGQWLMIHFHRSAASE